MCVADEMRKWSTFCSWLFQSICLAALSLHCVTDRHVDRQFKRPPGVALSNCLFSASAIVTKALCEGHPEFCVLLFYGYHYCYFVVPVDVFCFLCADDYLNAKNTI